MNCYNNSFNDNSFEMLTAQNLAIKSTPGQTGMISTDYEKHDLLDGLDQNKITLTEIKTVII